MLILILAGGVHLCGLSDAAARGDVEAVFEGLL